MPEPPPQAGLVVSERNGERVLAFSGGLSTANTGRLWVKAMRAAQPGRPLVLDLHEMTFCDTTGATLLLEIERAHGSAVRIAGASERVAGLLERARKAAVVVPRAPPPPTTWREAIQSGLAAATGGIAFLGELAWAVGRLPKHARMFRLVDLWRIADQAGVQAMPLAALLGLLMGLVLAFQSLVPMHRFGADLFVADLVSISLLRELGPLLTAVILAGRTGSAFAAEIGTMKVNQELDAMITIGIDPATMLVLPRMAAVGLVAPVLIIWLELAGLLGMTIVLYGSGIPLTAIASHITGAVVPVDLYGGLFKGWWFAIAIAAIGCRAGIGTGAGPRAVGEAATAAVVGGIVSTILLDGVFAVLFNRLGL